MTAAKDSLLDAVREFGGEDLRDLWLFDKTDHEALFLRDDVASKVADVEVATHVDNERYGYITRDTYNQLHYASYEYTVRGFDQYEQFRTFIGDNGLRIGVFASFDRTDHGYNFARLHDTLTDVFDDHDVDAFRPEPADDA